MNLWMHAQIEVTDPTRLNEARRAMVKLAEATEQEADCLKFQVLPHRDNPLHFTLWEIWVTDQALDDHFEMAHTRAFLAEDYTRILHVEKFHPPLNEGGTQ